MNKEIDFTMTEHRFAELIADAIYIFENTGDYNPIVQVVQASLDRWSHDIDDKTKQLKSNKKALKYYTEMLNGLRSALIYFYTHKDPVLCYEICKLLLDDLNYEIVE